MYKIYTRYRTPVELILSISIFYYLVFMGEMLEKINFEHIVYAILSYIVMLELIKMLGQYVFDRRFKITLVLDTFFIFTLRETILVYSDKTMEGTVDIMQLSKYLFSINEKIFYIVMGIIIMITLLYFRPRIKEMENRKKERRNCE